MKDRLTLKRCLIFLVVIGITILYLAVSLCLEDRSLTSRILLTISLCFGSFGFTEILCEYVVRKNIKEYIDKSSESKSGRQSEKHNL